MRLASPRFAVIAALVSCSIPGLSEAAESMGQEPLALAESRGLLTPYGEYFLLGGGVTNFIDSAVKDRVDLGGTWDARIGIGSRFYVGAEVGYSGSARQSGVLGTNLVSNGLEGVLRVQYPYALGRWLVEPFAFGGAGWTHLKINDLAIKGGALNQTNDLFVVPLGGGVTLAYDHVIFDARFTYRQTFDETLVQGSDGAPASLKSWAAVASAGYEF